MSASNSSWNVVVILIAGIFLGAVAFAFSQSIFELLFVPIVVIVLWDYSDKVKRFEARLSQMEARLSIAQSGATPERPNPSNPP